MFIKKEKEWLDPITNEKITYYEYIEQITTIIVVLWSI